MALLKRDRRDELMKDRDKEDPVEKRRKMDDGEGTL